MVLPVTAYPHVDTAAPHVMPADPKDVCVRRGTWCLDDLRGRVTLDDFTGRRLGDGRFHDDGAFANDATAGDE